MSIKNRTIFTGDNLPILRGMDSESVDLIYLDPPFNSNRHYSAPIGSKAAGAEFKDAWTFEDTDAAWWGELAEHHEALYRVIDAAGAAGGDGNKAYMIYMSMRLIELKRVLKATGSIYLHCDPTMSHSLKLAMDAIFGSQNFRNELVWHYDGPQRPSHRNFGSKHDTILRYSISDKYTAIKDDGIMKNHILSPDELKKYKRTDDERYYYDLPTGDYTSESIDRLHGEGRIRYTSGGKARVMYFLPQNSSGQFMRQKQLPDVWSDIVAIGHAGGKERVGYPTQKPIALLARIIEASSNPGDVILDPFCGCATTCIAADILQRDWIGIDISSKAAELVKDRGAREIGELFGKIIHRTDIPLRDVPKPSRNIKHILYGVQEGKCKGCKTHFPYVNFTIDHIIARAKGGPDTDENLQLLCNFCNSLKCDRPMEYLLVELEKRKRKHQTHFSTAE